MSEEQAPYDTRSPAGRGDAHRGLERTIVDFLQWHGGYVFCPIGWTMQAKGTPDILACLKGRFVGVEVKTGRGRLYGRQAERRDAIIAAGGIWVLARTVDAVEDALVEAGLVVKSLT